MLIESGVAMAALAAVAGLVKLVTKLADRGPSAIDRPFLSTFHHGHEEEEEANGEPQAEYYRVPTPSDPTQRSSRYLNLIVS